MTQLNNFIDSMKNDQLLLQQWDLITLKKGRAIAEVIKRENGHSVPLSYLLVSTGQSQSRSISGSDNFSRFASKVCFATDTPGN